MCAKNLKYIERIYESGNQSTAKREMREMSGDGGGEQPTQAVVQSLFGVYTTRQFFNKLPADYYERAERAKSFVE